MQGVVGESVLHQVLGAQLPGKTAEFLQALQITALQVAASLKPATIDYIKLMTPVSNNKTNVWTTLVSKCTRMSSYTG